MLKKLLTTKKLLFVAIMLVAGINTWGQTDDFTDSNFTANPVWSGNTSNYAVITDATLPSGTASTDGSYLASNASTGNAALVTASTEIAEWKFSLGSGNFDPSNGNAFGVILMSNTALSGNIVTTAWTGYYLRIGVDGSTDRIELYKKSGSTNTSKVGEWTTPGNFATGALNAGLNLRITKSGGVFTLFYSTGFTYASTPTTNGGTVTDASSVINSSSFFGIFQVFANASAARRVYIDNVVLGSSPSITTDAATAITATSAILNGKIAAANTTVTPSFNYGLTTSYDSSITTVTPSSISGTTETSFTGTATGLIPNTTYNFRAAGSNSNGTFNGNNVTFVTLANVPGTPAISGATTTTLSVSLDATTQNSNPSTTQYAIQVTNNNQYVQTNGTLGATAVWATAATWGTKVVTGLTSNTLYTFQVKARNGATTPVETAFGATASGTTLAATSPTLSAGTITTFGSVCINTTATPDKTFILDGSNLTGDVSVGPLSGFTFSTASTGPFTSSLSLTPVSGSVLTDIYVRFTPTAVQSYNGNIVISGGGATSINVAAAGSGVNTSATVSTTAASGITSTAATLGGNVTAAGCGTVSRGVVYATTTNPAVGGTGVTNLAGGTGTGTFTVNASSLVAGTTYYARAYATNNAGTVYGTEVPFSTPPANDECAGAVTLTVNDAATNGTLAGSTFNPSYTNGSSLKDVWYKFTASCSGSHTITLAGFSGDADIYLFSGSTCPTNNNNAVGFASTTNTTEIITYTVTSGVDYYIRVTAWNATAETSPFTIRVQSPDVVPTVATGTASAITYQSATLPGTAVIAGCSSAITAYGIQYSTTSGFDSGTVTQVPASNIASGSFSVDISSLTPSTTYYYRAYATNAAGTAYSTPASQFITAAFVLSAPVATAPTNITTSGFTANWELVSGATSYRLDVSTSSTFGTNINTTDLIISEYVEGSSNNKYIEIFNGTGAAVNLSDYQLRTYANGSATPVTGTTTALSGTLANGATIVYRNSSANIYLGPSTSSNSANFNGNDAIAIYKISTASFVDIFGSIGHDPGSAWTSASNSTENKTLIRKPSVTGGVTNISTTGFPTLETEWTQQNIDVVTDLGSHTYAGMQADLLPGYANLTVNGLSRDVTGLEPNTTYYYRVRAFGNSTTSVNSNPISALTGFRKIWLDGAWNGNGFAPTLIDDAEIKSNYNTATNGTFNAAQLRVSSGTLTVGTGTSITINSGITIAGGAMVVENNANVKQNDANAVNSGTVTVKRQTPLLKRLDYKMWSSPVAGQGLGAFSPVTESNRFYTYNTQTNQYNNISNSNNFGVGVGYLIRMPNGIFSVPGYNDGTAATSWEGSFVGTPHNGTLQVGVSYYAEDPGATPSPLPVRGYNAIGNPYMSTISAGEFYEANADRMDGTFYFWSKTNGSAGTAYVAYTPGLGGTGIGEDAIQVGQGFIINVTMPSATTVTFNNEMRVLNNSNMTYRPGVAENATPQVTEKHRYWLKLSNTGGVKSQILVGYTTNATNGIDSGIDGKLLADNSAVMYTLADATQLMIHGRPLPFNNTDVVPVGYKVLIAGNYTISLENFDGLFAEGQNIYLKDKISNTVHNLNAGAYSFASDAGTFNQRFEIVYVADGALGTDVPATTAENVVVFKDGNALNIAAGTTEIASVAIYDTRGRLLYQNNAVNATETSVTTLQAVQQVLVVQVTTLQNVKISKKVVY